jgi:hypothetical protein
VASQTSIANYAGVKVGAETVLSSLAENNKLARAISAVWDIAVDATLAAHPWNFAITRASLSALVDAPAYGYARQFQRPSDMVRLVEVNDVLVWGLEPGADAPYQFEGDLILTSNAAPLQIRYVRRVTDTVKYSAGFVEALACKLAQEIALTMTESATTRQLMGAAFDAAIVEAKGVDGRENPPEIPYESDWIIARDCY